jgi:glutathione peroxidase
MKYIAKAVVLFGMLSFTYFQGIYNLPLKTIDGKQINLEDYRGKKILFIILPLADTDTSLSTADLSYIQTKYPNSLVVIGIPAEEAGFKKEDEARLKNLYKNQAPNFILSEGIRVKKTSGSSQSLVFQWLTDKERNGHFNTDVQGPGHKFFVNEQGVLYAVIGARTKLTHPVIDKILSKQLKK